MPKIVARKNKFYMVKPKTLLVYLMCVALFWALFFLRKSAVLFESELGQTNSNDGAPFSWKNLPSRHSNDNGALQRKNLPPWAIFYNIFLPGDTRGRENAISIIKEQLGQIGNSLKQQPRNNNVTLYYNMIDSNATMSENEMNLLCLKHAPGLECQLLNRYSKGDEYLTLQNVLEYCRRDDTAPSQKVTYLHPKGSFHPTTSQDNWRRSLTEAAIHPDCLDPPKGDCNLCGLLFVPMFTTFIPGNMWTASCSYVRNLLPLHQFQRRLETTVGDTLVMRARKQLRTGLYPDERKDRYGLDRYASEHWIGSHPHLRSCDLDHKGDGSVKHQALRPDEMRFQRAPHTAAKLDGAANLRAQVKRKETWRRREIFYLPGLLFKWTRMYQALPPPDSWVWSWFPDGAFWKDAVNEHGLEVVEAVTLPFYETGELSSNLPVARSTFDVKDSIGDQVDMDMVYSTNILVFYQVWIDDDGQGRSNEISHRQLSAMNQQLLQQNRTANIIISTVLQDKTNSTRFELVGMELLQSCNSFQQLSCEFDNVLLSTNHGHSLQRLYQYCQAHPDAVAAFVHNNIHHPTLKDRIQTTSKDSIAKSRATSNTLQHLAAATVSPACLDNLSSATNTASSYNVCVGWHQRLFDFRLRGNVFSSRCDYVRQLVDPQVLGTKLSTQIARQVLLSELRGRMRTQLAKALAAGEKPPRSDVEILGIDNYALLEWIGSSPRLKLGQAVDASQATSGNVSPLASVAFSPTATGPMSHEGMLWHPNMDPAVRKMVVQHLSKPENRRRESALLPGYLLRWSILYPETAKDDDDTAWLPSEDSWIWQWFPDGDFWKEQVQQHGRNVLSVVNGRFDDLDAAFFNSTKKVM